MNSLDAILAMLILLTSLGLLLSVFVEQEKNFEQMKNSLVAKGDVLTCMSVIDGLYASSVDAYAGELDCFVKEGRVEVYLDDITKSMSVIPEIKKEHFLEVKTSDHYK